MKGKGDGKKSWNSDFWLEELSNLSSDHALKSECWNTPPIQEAPQTSGTDHDDYSDGRRDNDTDQGKKESVDFDKIHIDWSLSDDDDNDNKKNTKNPNTQQEPRVLFDDEDEGTFVRPISSLSSTSRGLSTSSVTSEKEQSIGLPPPQSSVPTKYDSLSSFNGWSLDPLSSTSLVDFEPAITKLAPALMPTPITPKSLPSTTMVPVMESTISTTTTAANFVISKVNDDHQDNDTQIESASDLKQVPVEHHPSKAMNVAMKEGSPSFGELFLEVSPVKLSTTASEGEKQSEAADAKGIDGENEKNSDGNDDQIEPDLEEEVWSLESITKILRAANSPPPQSTQATQEAEEDDEDDESEEEEDDKDENDESEEEEDEEDEDSEEVEKISISLSAQQDVQQVKEGNKSESSVCLVPSLTRVSEEAEPLHVLSNPDCKMEKPKTTIDFESAADIQESTFETMRSQGDFEQSVIVNTQHPGMQQQELKSSMDQQPCLIMQTSQHDDNKETTVFSIDATAKQQQEDASTTSLSISKESVAQATKAVEESSNDETTAEPKILQGHQDASPTVNLATTSTEQRWFAGKPSIANVKPTVAEQQWSTGDQPLAVETSPTAADKQWSVDRSFSVADVTIKAAEQQWFADKTIAVDVEATATATATTQQPRSSTAKPLLAMDQSSSMEGSTVKKKVLSIADPVVAANVAEQATAMTASVSPPFNDQPITEQQRPVTHRHQQQQQHQSTDPLTTTVPDWLSSAASIWAPAAAKAAQPVSEYPARSSDQSSTTTHPVTPGNVLSWNSVKPVSFTNTTHQAPTDSSSIIARTTQHHGKQEQEQHGWSTSPAVSRTETNTTNNFVLGTGTMHDFDFGMEGIHQQQQASYNNKVMEATKKREKEEGDNDRDEDDDDDDSDGSESEYETDSDEDDEESVEQITVSLASLIRSKREEEENKKRQEIPVVHCTLTDLILGTKSEKIRNILAELRGEKPQAPADANGNEQTDSNTDVSILNAKANYDENMSPSSLPFEQKQIDKGVSDINRSTQQTNGMSQKQHDNRLERQSSLQGQHEQERPKEGKDQLPPSNGTRKSSVVVEKAKGPAESNSELKLSAFAPTFNPPFVSSPSASANNDDGRKIDHGKNEETLIQIEEEQIANGTDDDSDQEQEEFRYISAECPTGSDTGVAISQGATAINSPLSTASNHNNNSKLSSVPSYPSSSLFTPPKYFEELPSSSSSLFVPPKYFEFDEHTAVASSHYVSGSANLHQFPVSKPVTITCPESSSSATAFPLPAAVAAGKRMSTSSQGSNNSSIKSTGVDSQSYATYTKEGTVYLRKQQQPLSTTSFSSSTSSTSFVSASESPSRSNSAKLNLKAPVFKPSIFKS